MGTCCAQTRNEDRDARGVTVDASMMPVGSLKKVHKLNTDYPHLKVGPLALSCQCSLYVLPFIFRL
jgi:hypothetical protein